MAKGIGRQYSVGLAKESSRGTAISSATYWLAFSDAAIDEKFNNVIDEQAIGVVEDSNGQTRVKNWAEGPISAPIADKHFGLILLSLFGTDTPTTHAGETIVYDHAFTVQQGVQHQSLTVFLDDPITTVDYKHALAVVTKLDLDYALGKFVEYTATIKALKGATGSQTPSITTENRFVPQYLTFKSAANLSGLAAATAIPLKSLKLSIDAGTTDDDVLGNVAPRDFLNTTFSVEGQLEAMWQTESDFKTNALANTAQALRLDLINTDVTIGSATNPELKIDLAKVIFTEFSRPIKIKDVVYQTVKFKASYSTADSQMIKATLTNLVATY